MYTWDSSVNVICSIFTNNGAANHGGILDTSDSSLIILSAVCLHTTVQLIKVVSCTYTLILIHH